MQTILHHRVDPSILLLAAPPIAGLLPATVSSSTVNHRDNHHQYQYADPSLALLPPMTRTQLFEAADQLLKNAVSFLSAASQAVDFEAAGLQFMRDVKALSTTPIVEVITPSRYRSREEMDAELQVIVDEMATHLADHYAATRNRRSQRQAVRHD